VQLPYFNLPVSNRFFKPSAVTIQSRVARNKFCWGLGVRAVRAGSIGRDDPRLEENAASPKWGAGGLGPRPLREDPSAL